MPALVVVLRVVAVLAVAGPMALRAIGRASAPRGRPRRTGRERAPVIANLASFVLFFVALFTCTAAAAGALALPLAAVGAVVALAGAAFVLRSRAELGPAWSLVPSAEQGTGLVTTGPYRLVRHPIYLGLIVVATGQALAFANWPALVVLLVAGVPTFAWRALAEERLLSRAFGERHAEYRRRTRMIIPGVL